MKFFIRVFASSFSSPSSLSLPFILIKTLTVVFGGVVVGGGVAGLVVAGGVVVAGGGEGGFVVTGGVVVAGGVGAAVGGGGGGGGELPAATLHHGTSALARSSQLTLFHQTVRQSSPTIPPGFFCFLSKKKKSTEFFFLFPRLLFLFLSLSLSLLPVSPELAFQDHQNMLGVGLWPGVDEVMYLDRGGWGGRGKRERETKSVRKETERESDI